MERTDKQHTYDRLQEQLAALLTGERDLTANAANTAALLFHALHDVNWAGFYFDSMDASGLEQIVHVFCNATDFPAAAAGDR